jgi:hypothetical protein
MIVVVSCCCDAIASKMCALPGYAAAEDFSCYCVWLRLTDAECSSVHVVF